MLNRSLTRLSSFSVRRSYGTKKPSVLPGKELIVANDKSFETQDRAEFFAKKKVVLFGVPGAFTPLCSNEHVPSFLKNAAALKEKGIDTIACLTVNDPYVVRSWAKECKATDDITFIADWAAEFVTPLDLAIDLSAANLGVRSKRFVMILDNGKIVRQHVELSPGGFDVTTAEKIIEDLNEDIFNDSDSD